MGLDRYRTLGRSGLHVSPLCLGAMMFGGTGDANADEQTSFAILDAYREAGGNFIDTSNVYTRGDSERILGRWLHQTPHRRDRTVLATKYSGTATLGDPNSGGASRKAILAACDNSLRRLQTNYIDLYWMHWQDPFTPIEESMRALDTLVEAGKVRYIGFSDVPSWKVAQAQGLAALHHWSPLIALQIEYSLAERGVEFDYVPMASELGLGITPWSPLMGGALTGKYRRDGTVVDETARARTIAVRLGEREYDIIDAIVAIGERIGCTPGQVALAWLLGRPGVTSPIIGMRNVEQYRTSVGALEVTLPAEDIEALDRLSKPRGPFPHHLLKRTWGISHGSLTINDRYFKPAPHVPPGEHSLG